MTRRVEIEHPAETCGKIGPQEKNGPDECYQHPLPGPNQSSTSIRPKEHRLMADSTHAVHVCTDLRAVRHTGGAGW